MERDHMSFRHLGRRESGLLLLSVSPLRPLTTDRCLPGIGRVQAGTVGSWPGLIVACWY